MLKFCVIVLKALNFVSHKITIVPVYKHCYTGLHLYSNLTVGVVIPNKTFP